MKDITNGTGFTIVCYVINTKTLTGSQCRIMAAKSVKSLAFELLEI